MRLVFCGALLAMSMAAAPVLAVDLAPNSGAVSFRGTLSSSDGDAGEYAIEATLAGGNFTGRGAVAIAGQYLEGDLVERLSFVENGWCTLRIEQGRTRFELFGRCNDESFGASGSGSFDSFFDGGLMLRGEASGSVSLGGPAAENTSSGTPTIPTGKLTCAWQEVHFSADPDQPNEYQIAYSMMVTLTLSPDGTYRTAASEGTYAVADNRLLLLSGAFAGAIGTLEPDRSGQPAVVFYKAENRGPDGVPRIDPETTHCTLAN